MNGKPKQKLGLSHSLRIELFIIESPEKINVELWTIVSLSTKPGRLSLLWRVKRYCCWAWFLVRLAWVFSSTEKNNIG
jgi:hypothetical protein